MDKINSKRSSGGFTLLELLVTLSIVGVLMALAGPSFSNMLLRSKVRTALNEWQTSYYFAQSEAMRLKDKVIFCASNDGKTCNSKNFKDGWIIVHNNKNVYNILQDVPPLNTSDLEIKLEKGPDEVNNANITFLPTGRIGGNFLEANVKFEIKQKNKSAAMTLSFSSEGRIVVK